MAERSDLRKRYFLPVLGIALLAMFTSSALAQDVSGLQAAGAIESALVDAIAKCEPSVVAIARDAKNGGPELVTLDFAQGQPNRIGVLTPKPRPGDPDYIPNAFGTGVVVDRRGMILTPYHVLGDNLEGSDYYVTTHERRVYHARIKAADPRSDLAVLEIDANDLTPITWGHAETLKKGQIVVALGNPYAIARDGQASASWGIVANLARKATAEPDGTSSTSKDKLHHFGTLIQTDAKLNLGTSGGALINLKGEMVGLTTSLAAIAGYEQSAGFAIPVDGTFRRVVETLMQGREVEYGFLGIRPENLREYEMRSGLRGMRVAEVVRGTPAARFDLRPDDIITQVNGEPIFDADGLVLQVGKLPVDSDVKLTVVRDGQTLQMHAQLMKFPVRGKKVVTTPAPSWRGLRVDYVTVLPDWQRRASLGEIEPDSCVVITDVEKGSPAESANLKPDAVITRIGGRTIKSPREFFDAVNSFSKDASVSLRLKANSGEESVDVKPAG